MKKNILIALTLLLTSSALAAGPYQPSDKDRARWTMGDMMSWRTALAAYHQDHGSYPVASTMDDIRVALEKKYMAVAPMVDAWGNPYRYEALPGGYRIVSSGSDGAFEGEGSSKRGILTSMAADAVATHEGGWLFRFWSLE